VARGNGNARERDLLYSEQPTLPEGRRPSRHPGPLPGTPGNVTFYTACRRHAAGRACGPPGIFTGIFPGVFPGTFPDIFPASSRPRERREDALFNPNPTLPYPTLPYPNPIPEALYPKLPYTYTLACPDYTLGYGCRVQNPCFLL